MLVSLPENVLIETTVTDSTGRFHLPVHKGEFLLCIRTLGYKEIKKNITISGPTTAQWKFSGDKHKSLQVDTERTFHQRYPLAML